MAVPEAYLTSLPTEAMLTSRLSSGQNVTYALWVHHDSPGVHELFVHQPQLVERKLDDVFQAISLAELTADGPYSPPVEQVRECLYDLHEAHFGVDIRHGWMDADIRILSVED